MNNDEKISIISSVFRGRRYLKRYSYHLIRFAKTLFEASINLEIIIIANDPTSREKHILQDLAVRILDYCDVKIISVERETLYKSWNRGIRESTGDILGFWNVDDIRNADAVLDSLEMFKQGAYIVSFPFVLMRTSRNRQRIVSVKYYDERYLKSLDPKVDFILGPFFLTKRDTFNKIDFFDEQFRVTGDFEWQLRAGKFYSINISFSTGGLFLSDGYNLSGQESIRHKIEKSIIFKRYDIADKFKSLSAEQQKMLNSYNINQVEVSNDVVLSNENRLIIKPKSSPAMQLCRYISRIYMRLKVHSNE